MATVIVSLLLRRQMAAHEYPAAIDDMVSGVTARVGVGRTLRQWLLQAMHLHPKALFSSAVDAERAYVSFVPQWSGAREELQALVRQLRPAPAPAPAALPVAVARGFALDGALFPQLAAN
jgi:hypothetical protein